MHTLADFQQLFARALYEPEHANELVHDLDSTGLRRMAIHRETLFAALGNALETSYPSVAALLGKHMFEAIARDFAVRFPPRSAVLYEFGAQFPAYLKAHTSPPDHPALIDLAELDWAIDLTGHQPLHAFGPPIALSQAVALRLDASLRVLRSSHEVDSLREALLEAPGTASSDLIEAGDPPANRFFVLWRATEGVRVKRVSETSYQFASRLLAGHGIDDALNRAFSALGSGDPLAVIQHELFGTAFCRIHVSTSEDT